MKEKSLLFTPEDTKRARDILQKNQGGIDPVTKEPLVSPCLDHLHDSSQQVRGVLSREINVLVGKIENTYTRNIRYWCTVPLPDLLRGIAEYLEREALPIVHPGWKKKAGTEFNKLKASGQDKVLKAFGLSLEKPNGAKRKIAFNKLLSSRCISYGEVIEEIKYAQVD